jgi:hypothetical protein
MSGQQALDNEGNPVPSAELFWFTTGTANNATAYTTSALGPALDQPVVADSAGRFPKMYGTSATVYRGLLKDPDGATLADVDPVNPAAALIVNADITDATIAGAKLAAGAVVAHLGYTPANIAGGTMTGQLKAATSPTVLDGTEFGPHAASFVAHNAAYDIALIDAFRGLLKDDTSTPTWTLRAHATIALPVGVRIPFVVRGASGSVTITPAVGVELFLPTGTVSGSRTCACPSAGLLWQYATDKWVVVGSAGVT